MIGDTNDMLGRVRSLLPRGWFGDSSPVLDAVLAGTGAALADDYDLIQYAREQTRIATATDQFLDLISLDYLADTLPRRPGEADDSFRGRIEGQLLLEKGTRAGMIRALTILTGRAPVIFEPRRVQDGGAYGQIYYNQANYGSQSLPYTAFVTAYRPLVQLRTQVAGYDGGFYGQAFYTNARQLAGVVTDDDIVATINAVKPEGTQMQYRILD